MPSACLKLNFLRRRSAKRRRGPGEENRARNEGINWFSKGVRVGFLSFKKFVYLQIGNLLAVECEEEDGEHQQIQQHDSEDVKFRVSTNWLSVSLCFACASSLVASTLIKSLWSLTSSFFTSTDVDVCYACMRVYNPISLSSFN